MGRSTNTAKEIKKNKIRQKIQNANASDLIVIPEKPIESIENNKSIRRVAAYCRVSTDEEAQTSSFELQKSTYTEMITQHPGWELAGIYADEGISGTSFNHRDGMKQMIEDCKAGKIDMVITKSIARFARNIVDCLDTVEMLKNLPHPVGVEFETEHLYTLDDSGRMILAILSTVAEEESHSKSLIMNWSVENRFSKGIFLTPPLYGYDQDPETDKLVINKEEARVVRLCYCLYLNGASFASIAELLTKIGVKTYTGKDRWNSSTIRQMLSNERHYGAVLAHKTYTPDFLTHKAKTNDGQRKKYLREEDHEAIVSKTIFNAAIKKMQFDSAQSSSGPMPSLSVVDSGILSGYVSVNGRWKGFSDADFLEAAESVSREPEVDSSDEPETFTLDDYQVVSSALFSDLSMPKMTIKQGKIQFNTSCLKRFENVEYVEILLNPVKKCLAIRPAHGGDPNAMRWGKLKDSRWYSYQKTYRGLTSPLFELMDWNYEDKYCLCGSYMTEGEDQILLFDLANPGIIESKPRAEDKRSTVQNDTADATVPKDDALNTQNGSDESYNSDVECGDISFGEKVLFTKNDDSGYNIIFHEIPYQGEWLALRPATFFKYCADITNEEMSSLREESEQLLSEIKKDAATGGENTDAIEKTGEADA